VVEEFGTVGQSTFRQEFFVRVRTDEDALEAAEFVMLGEFGLSRDDGGGAFTRRLEDIVEMPVQN
jgi:hypothetical protein